MGPARALRGRQLPSTDNYSQGYYISLNECSRDVILAVVTPAVISVKRPWLDSVAIPANAEYRLLVSPDPDASLVMCRFVSGTRERGMLWTTTSMQKGIYSCARTML